MSPFLLAGLVVAATVGAWVLYMGYLNAGGRRERLMAPVAEREPALVGALVGAGGAAAAEPVPAARRHDEDARGVTRRQFLNRAYVASFLVAMGNFALASLDFLYPRLRGGFGAKIVVNLQGLEDVEEIKNRLATTRTPEFVSDGRFYLALFEGDLKKAAQVPGYKLANTGETGLVALFRKCVHLGCSVPWCPPAKWFECPCHGSKYSINGEYRDGPAPRSLDRFRVEIVNGKIVVDTSSRIEMPRGVVTSQPQPEGEHCVEVREG